MKVKGKIESITMAITAKAGGDEKTITITKSELWEILRLEASQRMGNPIYAIWEVEGTVY